jgi:hypothetical protein
VGSTRDNRQARLRRPAVVAAGTRPRSTACPAVTTQGYAMKKLPPGETSEAP